MTPRVPTLIVGVALCSGCAAPRPEAPMALRYDDRVTEISRLPLGSVGSAWVDVDGDGRTDVALANRGDSVSAQVFRQTETGFENVPLGRTGEGNAVAWGDADGDGTHDLVFAGSGTIQLLLARVRGGAVALEPAGERWPSDTARRGWEGVAFGDADRDGDLDVFGARWGRRTTQVLFRNGGRGDFVADTTVSPEVKVRAGAAHIVRVDGMPGRVLVTAAGGGVPGPGTFAVDSLGAPRRLDGLAGGLGSSLGDVDGDLDLDLFVGGFQPTDSSALYLNEGGRFTRAAPDFTGVRTIIGSAFGDIDNDGDLDLVLGTGYTDTGSVRVYANTDGRLAPASIPGLSDLPGPFGGVVLVDVDRDGGLDVFVASPLERNRLLMQRGGTGGWLQVELEGPGAWGARVILETTDGARQLRTVHQQSGYGGHAEPVAHFGFGRRAPRRVRIEWPSGRTSDLEIRTANQRIRARER